MWAIKSFDPFGYSVRKDKVLICLSWSLFGLVAVVWTYKLAVLRVLLVVDVAALVLAVGVVEVSDTLVAAMIYLNALAAWLKAMAFIFILKSVAPMVAAYLC